MPRRDFRRVRDRFARDEGLPFGRLLSRDYVLNVLESEGHSYRSRVFCPLVTLWGWLSQCLSQDKSLNEAVSHILAHRAATGLPTISASSASYSDARTRFPGSVMERMAKEIGRKVHDAADDSWNWNGRPVFLADGTSLSMPDTPENQLAYPQVKTRPLGLAFPIMRTVALISLATGSVVDMAFGRYAGKGTGESSLLHSMLGSMASGDILVADRYYPSYFTIAALQQRGVDIVSISHHARTVDFTRGHVLGPQDHIVAWQRPQHREHLDEQSQREMPDTIMVREFCIEIEVSFRQRCMNRRDRCASVTGDSETLARSSDAWSKATRNEGGLVTGRSAIRAVARAARRRRENSRDPVEVGREVVWPAWGRLRGNRFEAGLLRVEKAS